MNDEMLGVVRNEETKKIAWELIADDKIQEISDAALTTWQGWQMAWYIFAGFALVVAVLFWIFFPKTKKAEA